MPDLHLNMSIPSELNLEIMSKIRDGDYQHPGEEAAIDLLFKSIPKNPDQRLLDVACGFGGTAHYLQERGYGKIVGIDINPEILATAAKKYGYLAHEASSPEEADKPLFTQGDAVNADKLMQVIFKMPIAFDIIYIFSAFFLFPDQVSALSALSRLAKPSTQLLIFDYINDGNYDKNSFLEKGKPLMPNVIHSHDIETIFNAGGFEIVSIERIDALFTQWYQELMDKIERKRIPMIDCYGADIFNHFIKRYQHFLEVYQQKILGGGIITARIK